MCSIAGAPKRAHVEKMLQLMEHRAPDGSGVYDKDYAIGMGRLAIIDLRSDISLPFRDDGLVLSFNGEIYNYKELRKKLKNLGHKFETQTDTEVLLKAYKEWGLNCLDRLNGMFAFAIKDGDDIILARDIAGEKPLYYTTEPFKFASEAKALDFMCTELEPAHFLVYNLQNGITAHERYWELERIDIDPKTAEEQLEALLEDSIRLRTQSDVPYGLYYSGGVDSSLISTFHNFDNLFTYKDGDFSEEFKEVFPKILWHLDYPVKTFSPFGLWQLAGMARGEGIKVVLSGEGADELFGGYVRYLRTHFNHKASERYPSYSKMFQPSKSVNKYGIEEFNGNMRELLRMGDRMAAAWGIENRCPFLDKRIIEFAFSLPDHLKIKGLDTKVILRRILRRRMPTYRMEEKHGLYCSVNNWLGINNKFDKQGYERYQKKLWKGFL